MAQEVSNACETVLPSANDEQLNLLSVLVGYLHYNICGGNICNAITNTAPFHVYKFNVGHSA